MQLQGPMSEELAYNPDQLAICGPNERYSPPIVIFKDGVSATLLFRVDETTSRSQFLAHYAFPSVNHPDTGIGNKGGTQIGGDPTSGTYTSSEGSHYVQFSRFYGHFEILNRKKGF